jgi:hypothetical protein
MAMLFMMLPMLTHSRSKSGKRRSPVASRGHLAALASLAPKAISWVIIRYRRTPL